MTAYDAVAEKTLELSQKQQEEVLALVESFRRQGVPKAPRTNLRCIWQGFDISAEEFDEARREMWGSYR